MNYNFNANEIFEIAEQIERNGANFYHKAAELVKSSDARQILSTLAIMEEAHERLFIKMQDDMLKESQIAVFDPAFDPDGIAGLYLQSIADGQIFDIQEDPAETLAGNETAEDIFHMAIGREKDAVIFFLGMKDMVSENLGKSKIDGIIKEEMNHITILNRELAKFGK